MAFQASRLSGLFYLYHSLNICPISLECVFIGLTVWHKSWVPSHCGIDGNERVDQLAKETLDQDIDPLASVHYRVSHNQGYHLVCTWGQKWSFLHCPKNNCKWKSIDYSVWNPNFAKLSLIFIEIYKFENPSLTKHFRVGGATQCWYDIHFYWVLLMIIFNWTY